MSLLFSPADFRIYSGARLVRCPTCRRPKRYDARDVGGGFLFIEHEIECPNLDCCTWYDPMTERATVVPLPPREPVRLGALDITMSRDYGHSILRAEMPWWVWGV